MALTPVEIRHMTPNRAFFGYKTGPTDRLLADVAASFEDVWRERADLSDRVEQLEADLARFRELESLLRTTLVSAEQASADMKEQARREAGVILAEAHAEAREVQRRSFDEHERLTRESRRLRAQLTAALATLDEPATTSGPKSEPLDEPAREEEDTIGEEEHGWQSFVGGSTLSDADAA